MKPIVLILVCCALLSAGCGTSMPVESGWEYLGGPYGQDVAALISPSEPAGMLFAGMKNGDFYTSADTGTTWTRVSTIRQGCQIYRFISDPDNREKIYAATSAGLFVSTNSGTAWSVVPVSAGQNAGVGSRIIAIDPWNPKTAFAGTSGKGIFKTADGGETWIAVNDSLEGLASADVYDIAIDLSRPDVVFAAVSPFGVIVSKDAGKSWQRLTEEFSGTGSVVTHIALHPKEAQTIVYATSSGAIRKSTDGGASWSPTRTAREAGCILTLTPVAGTPEILAAGTEEGVYLSSDFGTTWTDVTGTLPHISASAASAPGGQIPLLFAFGEGIGLQRSVDGGITWSHADRMLGGATVNLLTSDEKCTHVYAALDHTVLAFDSPSYSWIASSTGLAGGTISSLTVDSDSPLHLFAATSLGGFQSTNGGRSWQLATRNLRFVPSVLEAHPYIHTRMLASGDIGVFISTDKGDTWQQSKPLQDHYVIRSFTFVPTNAGTIFGATTGDAAVSSANGGFTWDRARYGMLSKDILAITIDDQEPGVVYAWGAQGMGYRSINNGLEWNTYAPPWNKGDTVQIACDRFRPSSVVALINGRSLYYSVNGGGTWFTVMLPELQAEARSLLWNASTAALYVGTKEKGVFRLSLGQPSKAAVGP